MELSYKPLQWKFLTGTLILLSYLLNPYTVLSCVAKSTCVINNAVITLFILATVKGSRLLSAVFLSLATYQSLYPVTLLPPALLYLLQVPDLTPNIGLFWYFFAEMFEHFSLFFVCIFQINVFFYTLPLTINTFKCY
ncbi:hypothetical protein XELAEV_18029398mg [Xenopus laevis]|uniref:Uncharacterized protein n=1 Tax=Xenopus laevis TaxID=8355 RepID=A0A974CTC9_XENLA|nr:hypothetical protein XELAEV_18029398mg [Xenopus laevis]